MYVFVLAELCYRYVHLHVATACTCAVHMNSNLWDGFVIILQYV